MLVEIGVDVNAVDREGRTPLHWAAWREERCVESLVELGADVAAVNRRGETALHVAVFEKGEVEVVREVCRILVDAEVDRGVRDRQERTALDVARGREKFRKDPKALLKLMKGEEKGLVARLFERGKKTGG